MQLPNQILMTAELNSNLNLSRKVSYTTESKIQISKSSNQTSGVRRGA